MRKGSGRHRVTYTDQDEDLFEDIIELTPEEQRREEARQVREKHRQKLHDIFLEKDHGVNYYDFRTNYIQNVIHNFQSEDRRESAQDMIDGYPAALREVIERVTQKPA